MPRSTAPTPARTGPAPSVPAASPRPARPTRRSPADRRAPPPSPAPTGRPAAPPAATRAPPSRSRPAAPAHRRRRDDLGQHVQPPQHRQPRLTGRPRRRPPGPRRPARAPPPTPRSPHARTRHPLDRTGSPRAARTATSPTHAPTDNPARDAAAAIAAASAGLNRTRTDADRTASPRPRRRDPPAGAAGLSSSVIPRSVRTADTARVPPSRHTQGQPRPTARRRSAQAPHGICGQPARETRRCGQPAEPPGSAPPQQREVLLPAYLAPSGAYSIRCELNTVRCAARTSREITLLICSSTAVTEAIMAYRRAPLVGHQALLRLVDLLRC